MRNTRSTAVTVITVPEWPHQWTGWRFAGNDLISPDRDRISPERLRGLLWRDAQERRLATIRARNEAQKASHRGEVVLLRMPCRDWHRERYGTSCA